MLQAILLTDCFEQLMDGSCPGVVLDHFECRAKALREDGADPLAQQAHYEDDALLIKQVGHPLCTFLFMLHKFVGHVQSASITILRRVAQVPLSLHDSMEAISVDMSSIIL